MSTTVFDDHARQAIEQEGSYAAARLMLRRAKADSSPDLAWHYTAVLASLERLFGEEAE